MKRLIFVNILFGLLIVPNIFGTPIIVSESGGDYTKIQDALNASVAGDTIYVKEKAEPYFEKIHFVNSGNETDGYIALIAYPGESPILDGTGVPNNSISYTDDLVYIGSKSYVRIQGFQIRNVQTKEGSGIRVYGSGTHIELIGNEIYEIRGGAEDGGAMGITVYGSNDNSSINNIIIKDNYIHDCDPAFSEALVLNGNVENFLVTGNIVEDVNNIGIDFIGGESWLSSKHARNGICSWNQVYNANSSYGDGYAAGIYVDGGSNIIIENNIVSGCDLGIEIGAENNGTVTENVVVRNNLVYENEKTGIVFGGYASYTGRVKNCDFYNNTLYKNDVLKVGNGEFWIQYAEDCTIKNNIVYSNDQNILIASGSGNINNTLDYNLWYTGNTSSSPKFKWQSTYYFSLESFTENTGQATHSYFVDPLFIQPEAVDFHLAENSLAINTGTNEYNLDETVFDLDSLSRIVNDVIDIGAYEYQSVLSVDTEKPNSFKLLQTYPNPFNGTVQIVLDLPANPKEISVTVWNTNGQKVADIYNGRLLTNNKMFTWQPTGNAVASGVYIVNVKGQNLFTSSKVVYLK